MVITIKCLSGSRNVLSTLATWSSRTRRENIALGDSYTYLLSLGPCEKDSRAKIFECELRVWLPIEVV